jgi:hypothetical protein
MTLYALVRDNIVVQVEDLATEGDVYAIAGGYQNIIDLTNVVPKPVAGWSFHSSYFSPPAGLDVYEIIRLTVLRPAAAFGLSLKEQFTLENIAWGVTQAGKSEAVGEFMKDLSWWLENGSLYVAMAKMQRLIDAGVDPALAPFVTADRLAIYKARVLAYIVGPH